MDFDTGETTLNICNSILMCDVSGQLVMTNVIFLPWLKMFRSQGIFSASILQYTSTSGMLAPPSHSKVQFLLGRRVDDMIYVKSVLPVIVSSLGFVF